MSKFNSQLGTSLAYAAVAIISERDENVEEYFSYLYNKMFDVMTMLNMIETYSKAYIRHFSESPHPHQGYEEILLQVQKFREKYPEQTVLGAWKEK